MAKRVQITEQFVTNALSYVVNKGDVELFYVDFTPWQQDNATVTAVTWTVQYGQAAVASPALASGIASARMSFPEAGTSLVIITATAGSIVKKIYLYLKAEDYLPSPDGYES